MRFVLHGFLLGALTGLAALSTGCAKSVAIDPEAPSARAEVPADRYAQAFDATKATLRDLGFVLERVDAQAGVITTEPRGSAGVVAPWDPVQSGMDQEFEDLFQRQQRAVRVEFVPEGLAGESPRPDDLRAAAIPVQARVSATVYRLNRDGLRINTRSIVSSTYAVDTELQKRGMLWYPVAMRQDDRLAARIAAAIAEACREPSPATATGEPSAASVSPSEPRPPNAIAPPSTDPLPTQLQSGGASAQGD